MLANNKKIIDIALIPILAAILFALEQLLSFLPNIQLTVFIILLYSKKLGIWKTAIIIIIHVILDNLLMGSFNFLYLPFMFVGWLIIPITINTIFKKVENSFFLALLGILFAFLYSWSYIIPNCLILNVRFWDYLAADLMFELLLAISSFISILWLYKPCAHIFEQMLDKLKK